MGYAGVITALRRMVSVCHPDYIYSEVLSEKWEERRGRKGGGMEGGRKREKEGRKEGREEKGRRGRREGRGRKIIA